MSWMEPSLSWTVLQVRLKWVMVHLFNFLGMSNTVIFWLSVELGYTATDFFDNCGDGVL